MSAGHFLGLTGARVMQTAPLLLAERAIGDLVDASAMGVMHGEAGTGKSFAAQTISATLGVACCWVQFPSRPTMLHVAQRLLLELSGEVPKGNRFALSDRLCDLLADRPRLLVVDEAQWLNRECIEYLRHLHDQPATCFALLLVGGHGCWEVLSREPMLRSRIYRRVTFAAMDTATVLQVIPAYHPLYHDADRETLALIDERFAHGRFRDWAAFTHSAVRSAGVAATITRQRAEAIFAAHGHDQAA